MKQEMILRWHFTLTLGIQWLFWFQRVLADVIEKERRCSVESREVCKKLRLNLDTLRYWQYGRQEAANTGNKSIKTVCFYQNWVNLSTFRREVNALWSGFEYIALFFINRFFNEINPGHVCPRDIMSQHLTLQTRCESRVTVTTCPISGSLEPREQECVPVTLCPDSGVKYPREILMYYINIFYWSLETRPFLLWFWF